MAKKSAPYFGRKNNPPIQVTDLNDLYDAKEVADVLDLSKAGFRGLRRSGILPQPQQIGIVKGWPKRNIDRFAKLWLKLTDPNSP